MTVHIGDITTWNTGCTLDEQDQKVLEDAQDVARAIGISVPAVYKAVALVARDPRPFRERFERCQRALAVVSE